MKEVMTHIHERGRELADHPFLVHVRNADVPAQDRLGFAFCVAPFVMSFADLNRFALRDEATEDQLQEIINRHTSEDDDHWLMYLDDLETLGLNVSESRVSTLRLLWGEHNTQARRLTYGLVGLIHGTDPVTRIAIVEAIEVVGAVALQSYVRAAHDFTEATGKQLRYFGTEHVSKESGHPMGTDDAEDVVAAIELVPTSRAVAVDLVDRVFDLFSAMFDEQLAYMGVHRSRA